MPEAHLVCVQGNYPWPSTVCESIRKGTANKPIQRDAHVLHEEGGKIDSRLSLVKDLQLSSAKISRVLYQASVSNVPIV
jgi:hypothetical protein